VVACFLGATENAGLENICETVKNARVENAGVGNPILYIERPSSYFLKLSADFFVNKE